MLVDGSAIPFRTRKEARSHILLMGNHLAMFTLVGPYILARETKKKVPR